MNEKSAKQNYCERCSPVRPANNICSPLELLTGAIYNFNFCPYCGRKLPRNNTENSEE